MVRKKKTSRPLPPTKPRNSDVRTREYLTAAEIRSLKSAASKAPLNGFRDRWLISLIYAHALRVSEACDLRWEQVDLKRGKLDVVRMKNGAPSVHYLEEAELKALRQLRADHPDSQYVFNSQRLGPLSARQVHTIIARAGESAGLEFSVHPHMLRHSKGYQLVAKGFDTRAIQGYFGTQGHSTHGALHSAQQAESEGLQRFRKRLRFGSKHEASSTFFTPRISTRECGVISRLAENLEDRVKYRVNNERSDAGGI